MENSRQHGRMRNVMDGSLRPIVGATVTHDSVPHNTEKKFFREAVGSTGGRIWLARRLKLRGGGEMATGADMAKG